MKVRFILVFMVLLLIISTMSCGKSPSNPTPVATPGSTEDAYVDGLPKAIVTGILPENTNGSYNVNLSMYSFTNSDSNMDADEMGKRLADTDYLTPSDESQKESFIKAYLQERNMYKDAPDGISYDNGKVLSEYYIDNGKRMMCLVLHIASDSIESIYCLTVYLDKVNKNYDLNYSYDESQGVYNETSFGTDGNKTEGISYKFLPNIPYPFILNYENNANANIYTLFSNQKFWIFNDLAQFDDSGKWTGCSGNIYGNINNTDVNTCFYNDNGTLNKIESVPAAGTNYDSPGEIELTYNNNNLISAKYNRIYYGMDNTDSRGTIHYDENGRMIFMDAYVTHGSLYDFYLYNGKEQQPWAHIHIDSDTGKTSSKNGIEYEYGDSLSVYLYQ
ncbi:MAG: hypothetical protein LBI03_06760 [Clostridiales bacterium]|nr:hypothetical protein [Clostridiales bacterium]